MQVLDSKFFEMPAANFWPNSLCGAKPVKQRKCQTKARPHKTTICSAGGLLNLQMVIWKLKVAIWKPKMAIWKLKLVACK